MHRKHVHGERAVVFSTSRNVECVVEDDQPRRGAGLEAALAHRVVFVGIRRPEDRPVNLAGASPDSTTVPRHALVARSLAFQLRLLAGREIGVFGTVNRIDVMGEEALDRGTWNHRHAPGAVHGEADIRCARIAMADEEPARQGEVEHAVTHCLTARLPPLEGARVIGRNGKSREFREPVCPLAVRDFAPGPDRCPGLVGQTQVFRCSELAQRLTHGHRPRMSPERHA